MNIIKSATLKCVSIELFKRIVPSRWFSLTELYLNVAIGYGSIDKAFNNFLIQVCCGY